MEMLTLKKRTITKIGHSNAFIIPKPFFDSGLLDADKTYKVTIEEETINEQENPLFEISSRNLIPECYG